LRGGFSGKIERKQLTRVDSLLVEIDHFADAVAGLAPYPITPGEIVATIAALEAITSAIASGKPVRLAG
jgi:predicted dehydrogenase